MPRRIPFKIPRDEKLKSALVSTTGTLIRTSKSPDEGLGELFEAVQRNRIYDDGKIFVDLIPKTRMRAIQQEYKLARTDPNFDLREFVSRHFYEFAPHKEKEKFVTDPHRTVTDHIAQHEGAESDTGRR